MPTETNFAGGAILLLLAAFVALRVTRGGLVEWLLAGAPQQAAR